MEILRRRNDIDLLFTDVVMPGGMNGKELADAALQLHPELKVLLTSGYSEDVLMEQGRIASELPLLTKPYTRAELAAALRGALNA
jgi:CheY-like chemotaxis protein